VRTAPEIVGDRTPALTVQRSLPDPAARGATIETVSRRREAGSVHASRQVAASFLGPRICAISRALTYELIAQLLTTSTVLSLDGSPVDARRGVVQFLHPFPAVLLVAAFRVAVEAMLGRWRKR
jgi:hypothetical protein